MRCPRLRPGKEQGSELRPPAVEELVGSPSRDSDFAVKTTSGLSHLSQNCRQRDPGSSLKRFKWRGRQKRSLPISCHVRGYLVPRVTEGRLKPGHWQCPACFWAWSHSGEECPRSDHQIMEAAKINLDPTTKRRRPQAPAGPSKQGGAPQIAGCCVPKSLPPGPLRLTSGLPLLAQTGQL